MARVAKKPKYAEFETLNNTYAFNEDSKPQEYFSSEAPLILELGCGKAEPTLFFAQKYPKKNFIGIDVKADRLWRPAKNAIEADITNAKFLKMHMRFLDQAFEENSIDAIWLTFSDPYPKARQEKHRLTHPKFLEMYKKALKPGGSIFFKTDNLWLFDWSIAQFANDDALIIEDLTYDLHGQNEINKDAKVVTYYEGKFIDEGLKINFCRLSV